MMKKKILWLVTARSGSKSIPHKNIKVLGKRPLLAYRINAAKNTKNPNTIWVSTDSKKYANIAKKYGGTVPFLRPQYLSTDTANSVDVALHACKHAKKNKILFHYIGILEPTSPFIKSSTLDAALKCLKNHSWADGIVSTRVVRPNSIFVQKNSKTLKTLAYRLKKIKKTRRQDRPTEVTPSGGFYIAKVNSLNKKKTFYTDKTLSWLVNDFEGLEIDEQMDWLWAEFLLKKRHKNKWLI